MPDDKASELQSSQTASNIEMIRNLQGMDTLYPIFSAFNQWLRKINGSTETLEDVQEQNKHIFNTFVFMLNNNYLFYLTITNQFKEIQELFTTYKVHLKNPKLLEEIRTISQAYELAVQNHVLPNLTPNTNPDIYLTQSIDEGYFVIQDTTSYNIYANLNKEYQKLAIDNQVEQIEAIKDIYEVGLRQHIEDLRNNESVPIHKKQEVLQLFDSLPQTINLVLKVLSEERSELDDESWPVSITDVMNEFEDLSEQVDDMPPVAFHFLDSLQEQDDQIPVRFLRSTEMTLSEEEEDEEEEELEISGENPVPVMEDRHYDSQESEPKQPPDVPPLEEDFSPEKIPLVEKEVSFEKLTMRQKIAATERRGLVSEVPTRRTVRPFVGGERVSIVVNQLEQLGEKLAMHAENDDSFKPIHAAHRNTMIDVRKQLEIIARNNSQKLQHLSYHQQKALTDIKMDLANFITLLSNQASSLSGTDKIQLTENINKLEEFQEQLAIAKTHEDTQAALNSYSTELASMSKLFEPSGVLAAQQTQYQELRGNLQRIITHPSPEGSPELKPKHHQFAANRMKMQYHRVHQSPHGNPNGFFEPHKHPPVDHSNHPTVDHNKHFKLRRHARVDIQPLSPETQEELQKTVGAVKKELALLSPERQKPARDLIDKIEKNYETASPLDVVSLGLKLNELLPKSEYAVNLRELAVKISDQPSMQSSHRS